MRLFTCHDSEMATSASNPNASSLSLPVYIYSAKTALQLGIGLLSDYVDLNK